MVGSVCSLVSGDPSVPLAAAARLPLLHLVHLCSHSGEEMLHDLAERDLHTLYIFNQFYFTFLFPAAVHI